MAASLSGSTSSIATKPTWSCSSRDACSSVGTARSWCPMSRDCRNALLLAGAAASLACGDDDATFDGGGSAAEATSSSADATSTSAAVDSSEGALDESTESTSSSSTGPNDIPYPEACEAPEATIEVAAATTP